MAELDLGKVVGEQGPQGMQGIPGEKGFSPTITESAGNTADIYKLTITNESGMFETPNLKGADGEWVGDSPVMGVKGSAEDVYRDGFVTITPDNLGLKPVATSGSYADLSDKPTIPDAGSSSNPVYFYGGQPVPCNRTLYNVKIEATEPATVGTDEIVFVVEE